MVRIGCGAGFGGDRLEPAVRLLEDGALDYLVLECLAERTIGLGQKRRLHDPASGYDPLLERRMRPLLPLLKEKGTRIVTNMGSANPLAAGRKIAQLAGELGLDITVAVVTGDDVLSVLDPEAPSMEDGRPLSSYGRILSANAYLGSDVILPALESGADVVITGRVADPSLVVAPLAHHFGWDLGDAPASARARLSAICWNAPDRSPAATSPTLDAKTFPVWPTWVSPSPTSMPTAPACSARWPAPAASSRPPPSRSSFCTKSPIPRATSRPT